ncbi:head decoration protein [Acinetobacter sp. YH12099]|uniref:head decoration protein n=1 Tax=Acinetobacter sp. YH12099 TaxID=2601088 RepID=UPI0015D23FB9|nr:head decoration protein [Acinetobacter sp. YH12099]
MTVTLGKPTSAWLANELDGNHRPSRENVVVAASQELTDGTVVSLNANGQAQIYAGATDEVAAGIFVGDAVTTGAGVTGAGVIVARTAKVVAENLTFKSGLATAKQTAALADLAKLHITTVRSA